MVWEQWRCQGGGGGGGGAARGGGGANAPPPQLFSLRATKGYTSVLSLSENVWLISYHYSFVNARIHETVFYSFNISL